MKAIFKILATVFLVLFLYAVYVQANDPDPLLWYVIYGVAALASVLFLTDKLPYSVAVVLFIAYVISVYVAWPAQFEGVTIGEGDVKNIEEGREALGLLITAVIMLIYTLRIKAGSKRR